MTTIQIAITSDRDRCGLLRALDDQGGLVAGPFAVAARSTDSVALAGGNRPRDPLFRYGDPPAGTYRLQEHRCNGSQHGLSADDYGAAGILMLRPVAGDAALAEANGRYTMAIIGGTPGRSGRLRSTAGAFRLADTDMRSLIKALGKNPAGLICQCTIVASTGRTARVEVESTCFQSDPLFFGSVRVMATRRKTLVASASAMGVFAVRGSIGFVMASAFSSAARAYNAIDFNQPIDIYNGLLNGVQGPASPDYSSASSQEVATAVAPTVGDVLGGLANSYASLYNQLPEFTKSGVDEGLNTSLDTLNKMGSLLSNNTILPSSSLPWVAPIMTISAAVYAAVPLWQAGQSDDASALVRSALVDAVPDFAGTAMALGRVPLELPETVVAVGVATAAIGLSLSGGAILVTSVAAVVGLNAALSWSTKKLAGGVIEVAKQFKE